MDTPLIQKDNRTSQRESLRATVRQLARESEQARQQVKKIRDKEPSGLSGLIKKVIGRSDME